MEYSIYEKLSAISQEMVGDNIPTTLFHYTSLSSIINIINSKKIWLSHYRYLNDPKELKYGLDVIKWILKDEAIFKKSIDRSTS